MHTFTYTWFFKLLYRYGNIPGNILLVFYLYVSVAGLDRNLLNIVPILIILFLIYAMNRRYFVLYKILPYKIQADNDKITGSDFIFSNREVVIFYKDINDLRGGIFDGRISGVMKVLDGTKHQTVGFFSKIKEVEKLQTFILSKVNRNIYDNVIERIGLKKEIKK